MGAPDIHVRSRPGFALLWACLARALLGLALGSMRPLLLRRAEGRVGHRDWSGRSARWPGRTASSRTGGSWSTSATRCFRSPRRHGRVCSGRRAVRAQAAPKPSPSEAGPTRGRSPVSTGHGCPAPPSERRPDDRRSTSIRVGACTALRPHRPCALTAPTPPAASHTPIRAGACTAPRPLLLRRAQRQLGDGDLVFVRWESGDPDEVVAVAAVAGVELEVLLGLLDRPAGELRPDVVRPLVGGF
jgi:hypothetical protein